VGTGAAKKRPASEEQKRVELSGLKPLGGKKEEEKHKKKKKKTTTRRK